MTSRPAAAFAYDPFGPDVKADPLPFYKVLRDEYPAYFMEQYDAWAISRFDDVWNILNEFVDCRPIMHSRRQARIMQ